MDTRIEYWKKRGGVVQAQWKSKRVRVMIKMIINDGNRSENDSHAFEIIQM